MEYLRWLFSFCFSFTELQLEHVSKAFHITMDESLIEKQNGNFANTVLCAGAVVKDGISLIHGDSLQALKSYGDNYFDVAIVDPPYGIGDTFIGFSSGAKKGKLERVHKEMKWDDNIPSDEYFAELKRVSKKQIIWGANYFNSFNNEGGALVWYKNRGGNTLSQCEIASVSGQKKVDYVSIQILTGFVADEERIHPTQKPVKLYRWVLENYYKTVAYAVTIFRLLACSCCYG
jgi:site-specific DNA-methyltransferase (adenine-specific)